MKIKVLAIAGAVALGACAGNAWADDSGWNFNVDLGLSKYSGISFQQVAPAGWTGDSSTGNFSYRLAVGYDFNRYLTVEGGYAGLGHAGVNASQPNVPVGEIGGFLDTRINAKGWVADVVGKLPLGDAWALYGRYGVIDAEVGSEVRQDGNAMLPEGGVTSWGRSFGVGVSRALGQGWNVHLGWDRYLNLGDSYVTGKYNVSLISLGVGYRFY
jgi:OmpA-OmpF porin, OOP family